MIRIAAEKDIYPVSATYQKLLIYEAEHQNNSNWKLGIYPTIQVPNEKVPKREMYVLEENKTICASMVLNHDQADEYQEIPWLYKAEPGEVLVIHTLCIPPEMAGRGYGSAMVKFAQEYAREHGYKVIRLDTYAHNEPAKHLYLKWGFRIAGYGQILLQGLIDEEQVYLEYQV